MKREIKFRVWDNEDYMSNGYSLKDIQNRALQWTDDCIVMQYTGLKDKNGVEIFEGDVLDCGDRIVKVIWHEYAGQWDSVFIKYKGEKTSNGIDTLNWKYRATVIGNIHETPELI